MRRFLALTGFLLLLIAAGWIALWLSLANRFENRLEAWANQRRNEGWIVAHGGIRLEGFPYVLRATVASPEIASAPLPDGRRRWHWQSEALIAEIDLSRQDTVILHPLGAQRAELHEAGRRLTVAGQAADLSVQATPDSAGGYRIDLAGRGIDLTQPAALTAIETMHARLILHLEQPFDQDRLLQPAFIELSGTVQGVQLAHRGQTARADFDLALMGCIGVGPLEDALANWRDEGGTLELRQLTVQDPVIDLRLRGTLALDDAMRPLAALSSEIAGYDAIMDMLVASDDVASRDAVLAKLLFAAMAETNPVTGRTMINIPISIQNGVAMAGPLRLAKINPLSFAPARLQELPRAAR